ncbi:alpha/beta hydrolase [Methylibium rhizosphaerae]|uniref:alpha/beta hydrolase n=1 Tax=Methylibium rhizosphaerae TaxID=2570323 RepID=UPI001127BF0F|nr:alpha/beta hydrolase [Methylibium rhizosphaerae]
MSLPRLVLAALVALCVLLALAASAPSRALSVLVPQGSHVLTPDIFYGTDPRQRFDLYQPDAGTAAPDAGFPMVVFFYGGSWTQGRKADYRYVGEALASRGIVTVVADYRLYPQVSYPQFLNDAAMALAQAMRRASHWKVDATRVFVMGHSAGAYNAAMLALDPRWLAGQDLSPRQLAGWIGLAGPYDFLPIRSATVQPVFHHPDTPAESQPLQHAAQSRLPAFLGAAPLDELVDPQRNTAQMAGLLQASGAPVTLKWYDGASHATLVGAFARPLRWIAPVLDDVVRFVHATPNANPHAAPPGAMVATR